MNVISKLSVYMQQRATEESNDLEELSRDQEGLLARKQSLTDLSHLVDQLTADNDLSEEELNRLIAEFAAKEVSASDLQKLEGIIAQNKARYGEEAGSHALLTDHDPAADVTWGDERTKIISDAKQKISDAKEVAKDSDDRVTFQIQYHWGNYSNYTQTASTLEKREDDHDRAIIGNIGG